MSMSPTVLLALAVRANIKPGRVGAQASQHD
jgi:hypothetical protein